MSTVTVNTPNRTITSILIGNTTTTPMYFFLKLDGVTYMNGLVKTYAGQGYRNYFATYELSSGNVYLTCEATVMLGTLAADTINNIEVYSVV